ncbi:TonB-dependent receptor [Oceanicaulis sp.]|uniref:TonB-dependent receptor n=1 Tax=Oceanicaulis sp. TaxID=1924941 RepID=UPI003F6FE816
MKTIWLGGTALALLCGLASPALSQERGPDAVLDVITVTAQKREQNIREVPLSIIALSSEMLEDRNITTALDLGRTVPNFYATRSAAAANVRIVVRGIGTAGNTAADQSTAFFLDGVYIPRPSILYASFLDIGSVEVVRGPQGTLFGRNATAGGVILNSQRPGSEFGGEVSVEFGDYGRQQLEGAVDVPVNDAVRLRFAAQASEFDGYGEFIPDGRAFGGDETVAARVSADFDLSPQLSWSVRLDHTRLSGDGRSAAEALGDTLTARGRAILTGFLGGAANLPDLEDPYDHRVNHLLGGDLSDAQWGLSSDLSYDFDTGYSLSLISGWRDYENQQYDEDIFYLSVPLSGRIAGLDSESWSHELRLVSPDDLLDGRFSFVAGLYASHEDAAFTETLSFTPRTCATLAPPPLRGPCLNSPLDVASDLRMTQSSDSLAVYAQGDYLLTPELTLQLGARYTSDQRDGRFLQLAANPLSAAAFRAPADTDLDFSDETPTVRLALNYTPSPDRTFFGSYSTGYKSGGFNSGGGAALLSAENRTFDSETAENFELGFKGAFWDNRMEMAVTLYRTELDDFQSRSFDGSSFLTQNAGSLVHQGFEADGALLITDHVELTGGVAYLDSEFDSFPGAQALPGCTNASPDIDGCGPVGGNRAVQDLTGGRNHFAPEWTGNLFINVDGELAQWGWRATAGFNYVGEQFVGGVIDNNPQVLQDGYALLSARLTLSDPSDRFSLAIFGENLTDEGYCGVSFYQPLSPQLGLTDPSTGGTFIRCNTGAPRTVGVRLSSVF